MGENNIPIDISDNILKELKEISNQGRTNDWNFFTKELAEKTPHVEVDNTNKDKRVLVKCEFNHEYFIKNAKAEQKCPTCTSTSSETIKSLRTLVENIFDKPFYKIYPAWAVPTDSKRKILMNMCNSELRIVFDIGGKISTRQKRKDVCVDNKYLYIYVGGKELAESNLTKHLDDIKKTFGRKLPW